MADDVLIQGVCEWLRTRGLLAPGVELRYGADLIQVLRDGRVVATLNPSTLTPLV